MVISNTIECAVPCSLLVLCYFFFSFFCLLFFFSLLCLLFLFLSSMLIFILSLSSLTFLPPLPLSLFYLHHINPIPFSPSFSNFIASTSKSLNQIDSGDHDSEAVDLSASSSGNKFHLKFETSGAVCWVVRSLPHSTIVSLALVLSPRVQLTNCNLDFVSCCIILHTQ